MKPRLVSLLIRLLRRTLDLPEPTQQRMQEFLATAWMDPGFRQYVSYRDQKIMFELAGGIGMKEQPRDDYVRFTGQRVEILLLAQRAKEAHARREEEKKKKLYTVAKP